MTNKVLVQVECASHALPFEGCTRPGTAPGTWEPCRPPEGSRTPYGASSDGSWAGPHATLKAALIEWIKRSTFNGAESGSFTVDANGVASVSAP